MAASNRPASCRRVPSRIRASTSRSAAAAALSIVASKTTAPAAQDMMSGDWRLVRQTEGDVVRVDAVDTERLQEQPLPRVVDGEAEYLQVRCMQRLHQRDAAHAQQEDVGL